MSHWCSVQDKRRGALRKYSTTYIQKICEQIYICMMGIFENDSVHIYKYIGDIHICIHINICMYNYIDFIYAI